MTDSAPRFAGEAGPPASDAERVAPMVIAMKPEEPPQPTLIALFESEESGLLAFAMSLVRRRSVAEELVQDAFLRLHEVWGQVENPRGWLFRSVRNLALNHLRDHRRETLLDGTEETACAVTEQSPDEELGRMEAIGMVRLLVAGMPAEDQELIRMKYHEDLKYGEISRRTGLGVGNVGYKLHHLLRGLADGLRHAGIEGSRG